MIVYGLPIAAVMSLIAAAICFVKAWQYLSK